MRLSWAATSEPFESAAQTAVATSTTGPGHDDIGVAADSPVTAADTSGSTVAPGGAGGPDPAGRPSASGDAASSVVQGGGPAAVADHVEGLTPGGSTPAAPQAGVLVDAAAATTLPPELGVPTSAASPATAPASTSAAATTEVSSETTTPTAPTASTVQPTTSTPSPDTTQPTTSDQHAGSSDTCGVSALLVPECGAWLGTSTPSRDGSYNVAVGLTEYEAVAQNVPDILHFYKVGAATFPTATEVALSQRSGRQDSLLLYNWKPSTSLTWRQIAEGDADANIHKVAANLQQYPNKLFLAIHHEPENDQGGAGSGRTPADYVDMYRHVVTTLRADGVTNAVFVMNFMGFAGWASVADAFYPGDDVVDWIAYDPYGHASTPTFAQLLNRPDGDWPGFYNWATTRAPGKPIMVGEWGFDLSSQPRAPDALDGAAATLASQFPMVKALVYWNSTTSEYNFRLDQNTALGQAYAAAYQRMANDPYFNSTAVSAPADAGVDPPPPPTATGSAPQDPPPEIPEFPLPVVAVASAALLGGLIVRRQRRRKPAPDHP